MNSAIQNSLTYISRNQPNYSLNGLHDAINVGLLKVYEKPKQRIIYIIYALWGLNKEKQGKVSGK
jgi:hypothetical protein